MVNPNRQIVLDTETTGMNQLGAHYEGHCIIEIGAVEMINRRYTGNNFHFYIKPHLMRLHSHFWIILKAQNY